MDPAFYNHEETTYKPQVLSGHQYQHMRQQPSSNSSSIERSSLANNTADASTSARAGASNSPSSSQSKHHKLDGVLYHFYSKTLAVITNCRLTHYNSSSDLHSTTSTSTPSTSLGASPSTNTRPGPTRKVSKWFDLEIADCDIFREEVRLWRNISTLIPSSVLEGPTSQTPLAGPSYVAPMVLDIILDTSALTERHVLMMDQNTVEGSKEKRRVRVDGKDWATRSSSRRNSGGKSSGEHDSELLDSHRKPIVLESWKLELGVCNPPNPPDLPTLYRHATANLKELNSLAKQLPAYSMYSRLQRAKELLRKGATETSGEEELLKIGVRLGVGVQEDEDGDDEMCRVSEHLGPSGSGQSTKVKETFTFQPIQSAIGILNFSVDYRVDADFYVENLNARKSLHDLELDEDYFRPSAIIKSNTRSQGKATMAASPISASPLSQTSSNQEGYGKPRSILSATSDRKQSIIAAETSLLNSGGSRGITPSPPADLTSRPSVSTPPTSLASVFSPTSSSTKPVAGLSSLRRSPSMTGHGSSPTTTMTPANATSTSAIASDAAFLTHGRRPSQSERRIRTLSSLSGSGDKGSPPASTTSSISPSSLQASSRPILARTSGSALPSLRAGSYSPSSPSPLAQQLSNVQHHPNAVVITSPQPSYRMSSSPSYRTASLPLSASPSLRSIFHSYTPSQSHTSVSSLSRTPPKSLLLEGVSTNYSSLGLQEPSTNQSGGYSSQSSLGEGRQQPSVAPQMIKRYSSTFNYRQGKQAASALSGGGGVTGSSLDSESSSGAPYSKSWQARIDQRQMFAARSLGREEGSHFSGSQGAGGGGGTFFASSYSPQSQRRSIGASAASQEEELDDFVRMIDSSHPDRAPLDGSSIGSSASHMMNEKTSSMDNSAKKVNMPHYTTASSGVGFGRRYGLNRNQVDEMLNKMQSSVREFSTSSNSRGTPSSGGSGSGQSVGIMGNMDTSPPIIPATTMHGTSPSFARSPLSKVGFSASSSSSSGSKAIKPAPTERQNAYRFNVSARREESNQEDVTLTTSMVKEESGEEEDGVREEENLTGSGSHHHHRNRRSRSSLDMYVNQPHSYDPLEDEAVGRLELVQDDLATEEDITKGGERGTTGVNSIQGAGGNGGMYSHRHHHHHLTDTGMSGAAERRRADIEMTRNFGQVVGSSSTRGNSRASQSPWRNRLPNQNSTGSNRGGTT